MRRQPFFSAVPARFFVFVFAVALFLPSEPAIAGAPWNACGRILKNRRVQAGAVITAAVLYAIPHAYLYTQQDSLMFHPTHADVAAQPTAMAGLETFHSASGDYIGYARVPKEEPKRVVLFFQGNTGQISDWGESLTKLIPDSETALVLMEYPGFGSRPGTPSQESFYSAGTETYDAIRARWPKAEITVYGYSMGTSVATYVAAEREVKKLALASPFYSMADMAHSEYPLFIVSPLLRHEFPTFQYARRVRAPVFIIHGRDDGFISTAQPMKLIPEFPKGARIEFIDNVGHALTNRLDDTEFVKFLRD